VGDVNSNISQAAKDVRAGQEALVDIFERIETFLRRLEIYTSVPPNEEMVDTITTIMVEILGILGIATKEIKQRRSSKYFLYGSVTFDGIGFRKISKQADRGD
jgi:hypothetical protein